MKSKESLYEDDQGSWNEDKIHELNSDQLTEYNGKNKILGGLEDYN